MIDFGRIYKDIMYLDPNIRMVTGRIYQETS